MLVSIGLVGVYIVLVGVASFAEKRVSDTADAFQLDISLRAGALLLAVPVVLVAHGFSLPGLSSLSAGVGIGAIAGVGAICYFLALHRLPVWLVVCLANTNILVTALLGIVVLGEAVTIERIAGLLLSVAGVILLSYNHQGGFARSPSWFHT